MTTIRRLLLCIRAALLFLGFASVGGGCRAEQLRDKAVPWIRGTLESTIRKWMIRQAGALPELWGDMCDAVHPVPGGTLAGLGFDVGLFTLGPSGVPKLLRRDHTWGFVHDIAVMGTTAYVAAGGSGLSWIDLRKPLKVRQAGPFGVNGYALTMRIQRNTGYLGYKDGGGLLILDLAKPGKPVPKGHLFAGEDVSDIEVFGEKIAIGVSNRVEILSIGESGDLSPMATVPMPRQAEIKPIDPLPRDIAAPSTAIPGAAGTAYRPGASRTPHLFVANGAEGMIVLDITKSAEPRIISTLSGHGFFESIVVIGDRAFVGRKGQRAAILDVRIATKPRWVGELDAYGRTLQDPQDPNRLLVAGGAKGWSIWTGSPLLGEERVRVRSSELPETPPKKIQEYRLPPRAYDVEPVGERLYVAAAGEGVKVLEKNLSGMLGEIGRLETPGNTHQIRQASTVAGAQALWISDTIGGFLIAHIEVGGFPKIVDRLDVGNHVWAGLPVDTFQGGIALADGQHGLSLFSTHNHQFVLESELFLNGYAVDIEPYKDYLYVATIGAGVAVVKTLPGFKLELVRTLKPSRFPPKPYTALAIAGDRLIVGDPIGSVYVYDLADPSNPKPLGRTRIGGAVFDLEAQGETIWAAAHKRGLVRLRLEPDGRLQIDSRHFEGQTVMGVGVTADEVFAAVNGDVRPVPLLP